MSHFRTINRDTGYLLPPSVDEWLPKRHLARFVVEIVEQMDLSRLEKAYRGAGSAPCRPSMLLSMLIYGYATGVFSSRKLERASYDSVAFRFIAGNEHPDHDTLAVFRKRFLGQIEVLFVQVLTMAREMGMLKLGTVALDGTKIEANASRHSALSYEYAQRIEAHLKEEVAQLLLLAEAADQVEIPDGLVIPAELERQEARRQAARAAERHGRREGAGEPHRRGLAHHARARGRLRAVLQRPSAGRHREPADRRERGDPGERGRAATGADAHEARRAASRTGASRDHARRLRICERGERRRL